MLLVLAYKATTCMSIKGILMSNTKILPCPFCGKQPGQRFEEAILSRSDSWHIISCDNEYCLEVCVHEATEREAIATWNHRADIGVNHRRTKKEKNKYVQHGWLIFMDGMVKSYRKDHYQAIARKRALEDNGFINVTVKPALVKKD